MRRGGKLWCSLMSLGLSGGLLAAGLTDAQWEQKKLEALNRPRKIIVDNDGCDATNFPKAKAPTIENFYAEMLNKTLGCQIDTLTYCPMAVGFMLSTRTKVFETHRNPQSSADHIVNITPILIDEYDTDPLELAVAFCQKHHFELFVSMRVNDVHDAWYPQWLPQFKKDHPELLCGTEDNPPTAAPWSSYDFAQEPVRAKFVEIIEELAANYAVDGVELDFARFPNFFRSSAWGKPVSAEEMELFTDMIRQIRRRTEEIGRADNRPILLAFRLPDTVAGCRLLGLDVERWMKEGLFDLYFAGGDLGHAEPWVNTAELCRKYAVKFYPSIDSSWIKPLDPQFERNSFAGIDGQTAAAWSAGADGIYYFNFFYQSAYFPSFARNPEDLVCRNKNYFVSAQTTDFFGIGALAECLKLPQLSPTQAIMLPVGIPRRFQMELGKEDPAGMRAANLKLLTSLGGVDLDVTFNGAPLELAGRDGRLLTYRVEPQCLKTGLNDIAVLSREAATPEVTVLTGGELLQGENQPPWRRLFHGNGRPGAEEIVDGAYQLTDPDGAGVTNFLYPLIGLEGGRVKVSVEARTAPGNQPETSVLRLGNGKVAEIISLEPQQLRLVGRGTVIPFDTADAFHRYEAELDGTVLTLRADGRELFREELTLRGDDAAIRLPESKYQLPEMQTASLLIGSVNRDGSGRSWWRNLQLAMPVKLVDMMLSVEYPPTPAKPLAAANRAGFDWDLAADFSAGAAPAAAGLTHNYNPARLSPAADGTATRLDHNDKNQYQTFTFKPAWTAAQQAEVLLVEWKLRIPPQQEAEFPARFQMILRPPVSGADGLQYECVFRFEADKLRQPWGVCEFPAGWLEEFHTFRAAVDPATGNAALWMDGEPLAVGMAGRVEHAAGVLWGDISETVDGVAELAEVKVVRVPGQ